ncbi:hypothetical protein EJ05DRAFT_145236 [Pseudovirgaria hyperparasitica]|uniref:DNA damage-binding protein 1 n=1 Tax=Pseudovirgaria hyperparasitica TaxID=470096 RepID=A0A6A6VY44_9PEZI|nr:uncharacterized protein EJ05DRAFT_145236 [Pseudovirgaria hyperparasitica]KAF2754570.1 hypothetical protein EJ05DRAFT_145236 [Pseudovirgaria hyperparasitica]
MAYIAPIHRPSSVRHALKLNFLSHEEESLVVAKANRIEIYSLTQDGLLSLQHSKALYGKVTILQKIRPESSPTDHLFIGTDRYMYFTVSWDPDSRQLKTEKSYVDLADRSARESQTGERCLVDPTLKVMTLEIFEGILTVLPIVQKVRKKGLPGELGSLSEPIQYRISEMFVRSSAFLYPRSQSDKPTIALLYEDTLGKVRLKLREIRYPPTIPDGDTGSGELDIVEGIDEELELGASLLIPVAAPSYGLLIIGETSIMYYSGNTKEVTRQALDEATIFVTWEQIDSQRFVLADDYGQLYLLMLVVEDDEVVDWRLDNLGEISRASVLIYLDDGNLFVGSHQGDSQVVKISERNLEIIQTFANVAPILDFTIMDMGNRSGQGQSSEYSSGQARIVTGSGAYQDGSLRSVRSGVGLEYLGVVGEMDHISGLFSLSSDQQSPQADTILVAFIDETRIFHFSPDGEAEEKDEFKGLVLSESTLLARNLPHGRLLQVTSSAVRITDLDSGMVTSEWKSPSKITAVAATDESLIVALGGIALVSLQLKNEIQEQAKQTFSEDDQVACIACYGGVCFVGFWQGARVAVLDTTSLKSIKSVSVAEDSVPRALLVAQMFANQPPTLFVAMADGNVLTFSVNPQTHELSGRKAIVLGTQQANFTPLPRGDGLFNVFASCDHPSLIYASEGRLVYSAVTAENATSVCAFDSEAFPEAIAIATPEELKLGLIDNERTTHVQTLQINETVRRIAYSPSLKAFGMGTIKRNLKDGVESIQSHFQLADEILFQKLDAYALNPDELIESVMRCELDDGAGQTAERFVVGTAYLDEERAEATQGRILVLEVTEDRRLKVVLEHALKGGCRCLDMVDGKIVAALIKTVVVFAFEYSAPGTPQLVKKASYRCSTAPIDLYVSGTTIAIADLMKSITIVEFKQKDLGLPCTLSEIARHFSTTWGTAVAEVDENVYLESDAEGNLIVLHRDLDGATADDRRRLRVTSEILLGELVNRIRRIDVATTGEAPVIPKAFLATVEGSIYLFALIHPSKLNLLITLQNNLAECVQTPGNVPFNKFRAYRTQVRDTEEPFRFVDGDLIERFLDCSPEVQETAVQGLEANVEEVRSMVEALRRLH